MNRKLAAFAVSLALLALPRAGLAAGDKPVKLHRFWLGFSDGLTIVLHPSGANVCASAAWTCAEKDGGPVFPSPRSSVVSGGTDVRPGLGGLANFAVGAVDVALTDGVLLGVRYGFYFHPQNVHVADYGLLNDSMLEARVTWVLGAHPLTRTRYAFRPYALFGFGMADFGAPVDLTLVVKDDVLGHQPVQAWDVAGPFFVTTGLGIRFGNANLGMMLAPLKIAAAFGRGGAIAYMPELSVMRSF